MLYLTLTAVFVLKKAKFDGKTAELATSLAIIPTFEIINKHLGYRN